MITNPLTPMTLLHYYGDVVRRLFLGGGMVMLLTLPLFHNLLPVPNVISLLIITVLVFVAGFISPVQRWIKVMITVIASLAVVVFGYEAITTYTLSGQDGLHYLFWINIVGLITATLNGVNIDSNFNLLGEYEQWAETRNRALEKELLRRGIVLFGDPTSC